MDAPFSEEDKAARLGFCYEHLHKPLSFWFSVVWLDEASLVLEPTPQPAIGERGTAVVVHDPRKQHHRYGAPHLNFTLAVNAYVGVVFFGFLHTSTGWDGKVYMVSVAPPLHAPLQRLGSACPAQLAIGFGATCEACPPWPCCQPSCFP